MNSQNNTSFLQTESFKRRAISSVAIVVISIGAILGGTISFGLLLIALLAIGTKEWRDMTGDKSYDLVVVVLIGLIVFGLFLRQDLLPQIYGLSAAVCFLSFLIAGLVGLVLKKPYQRNFYLCLVVPLMAFGYVYTVLEQPILSLLILSCIWVSDTSAYLVGKKFGKRQLCPNISPGKTVEGAAGAFIITVLYAFTFISLHLASGLTYAQTSDWIIYILCICVFAILVQLGDLIESVIKRKHQVKDSGDLIPGHGGVLDRIDGFILSIPFIALLIALS